MKFQGGNVGRLKYHVSRANVAMSVVGPMMIACSSRVGDKLWVSRRRKVIVAVGRRRTAREANIRNLERFLWVRLSGKGIYALEVVVGSWDREGHGQ